MTTSSRPSRDVALTTVTQYLAAIQAGHPDTIADLFHADATVEDPAGSTPVTGRAAIVDHYAALAATKQETELISVRHSGAAVAFLFTVRTFLDDGQIIEISPIDVMTLDADGLIVNATAFWSTEDVQAS